MDASAVAEFAAQSAQNRHCVFAPLTAPKGITCAGKPYAAVVSSIALSKGDLERGGWPDQVDVTIRVLRSSGFTPANGGLVTINHSGRVVRIFSIKDNVPEEWIIGCGDPEV
jgi:hypothetical protein